jgi:hypothetical protein
MELRLLLVPAFMTIRARLSGEFVKKSVIVKLADFSGQRISCSVHGNFEFSRKACVF